LTHSFSKDYFADKFRTEGLIDFSYQNFPAPNERDIPEILRSDVFGFNITIPYKRIILKYLNEVDEIAWKIGSANTLVKTGAYSWKGYNTDATGFQKSLLHWFGDHALPESALVLGSGGAAKAISFVLAQLGVDISVVSRNEGGDYNYDQLSSEVIAKHKLIVNTTPLGMFPADETCPSIPYEALSNMHWIYDLVYNPSNTLFLRRSQPSGAKMKNGLEMLHLQAEDAWTIWKHYGKF
jgi:shikimate dehydrogenase